MLRAACPLFALAVTKAATLSPLEAFTQIQLGITPPASQQRNFLLEYCQPQLERRGITEAKLYAMDPHLTGTLLRQMVYEKYLAVPFRVFSFDLEFTGPPVFTADGPSHDITEIGVYSPSRDETASYLVKPVRGKKLAPGVEELTHITDAMLASEGLPFDEVWQRFMEFVSTPEAGEMPGAGDRILLLSHGGKLADVSMLKWTLEQFNLQLPSSFVFGDTIHFIREAHRRRPVTPDKHPPSWKLGDLVQWLGAPMTLPAHRAGNDAKMTWDALYHTLLRYGEDEMTPREQLIPRFFDAEAKQLLRDAAEQGLSSSGSGGGFLNDGSASDSLFAAADLNPGVTTHHGTGDALDLDFDDIFSKLHSDKEAAATATSTAIDAKSDALSDNGMDEEAVATGDGEDDDVASSDPQNGVSAGVAATLTDLSPTKTRIRAKGSSKATAKPKKPRKKKNDSTAP